VVFAAGFPNLLMAMGPHAGLSNYTRTAEYSVEWIADVIRFANERGLTRLDATPAAVDAWTEHVLALGEGQLVNEIASYVGGSMIGRPRRPWAMIEASDVAALRICG
jgi:hypothetical protein